MQQNNSLPPLSLFRRYKIIGSLCNAVATTIARPNAMLFGGIAAFVTILGTYIFAKYIGLSLSGFELMVGFLFGWAAGIVFDVVMFIVSKFNN